MRSLTPALPLPPEGRARFEAVGRHLPQLGAQGGISQIHQKALLRALIDKVVLQRLARDRVRARTG